MAELGRLRRRHESLEVEVRGSARIAVAIRLLHPEMRARESLRRLFALRGEDAFTLDGDAHFVVGVGELIGNRAGERKLEAERAERCVGFARWLA